MRAVVIGGGPAGLMAAEALVGSGVSVLVADRMPTLGRKFLMAGKSGLNLTKDEAADTFLAAYGDANPVLAAALADFGPKAVQTWARGLGQDLFTGSTGRVFPTVMKASPLLRAWLARLADAGVEMRSRWLWTGWEGTSPTFDTPDGRQVLAADVVVLALGGASWARLGSDGVWADIIGPMAPFQPANCGFRTAFSAHMQPHFGKPLKAVALRAGGQTSRGEVVLTARGIEGGGIYGLAPLLREHAPLTIDLLPDLDAATVAARLAKGKKGESIGNRLRKALKLEAAKRALLQEVARPLPEDAGALAALLKALPVPLQGPMAMDSAISTAGGLRFGALDAGLMLRERPGVFAAGEMLDWEAPTGGYLLTACLATGRWAGLHAARWAKARRTRAQGE